MSDQVVDASQRAQALDPSRSFIVQAPAGSGKTELLTQRTLALLATVSAPEEIIAITFTRKAAAEMRTRILQALRRAENGEKPEAAHERTTLELAGRVLARSRELGWNVRSSPSRLRIQTIDSLCSGLVSRMPLLSKLGGRSRINDQPEELYQQAAKATIAEIHSSSPWSESIRTLLRHLDNDQDKTCRLISAMLAQRDQWLRHLADPDARRLQRSRLEQGLTRAVEKTLSEVRDLIPEQEVHMLLRLLPFAASNMDQNQDPGRLRLLAGLEELPGCASRDLPLWQALADFLLTKNGSMRKQANKNLGFPAPSSTKDPQAKAWFQEMKDLFTACTRNLAATSDLEDRLSDVRFLPWPAYTDNQWEVLEALFDVLRMAVGQLSLVFQDQGEVDFAEITGRARAALGSPQEPTDLALILDTRIQHLLIDEFQDTSISQFQLLQALTAGWTPGDGRTFFAVGDPMQSIYSFREAEVGLFLMARQSGLGHIPLTDVYLSVNFRSQSGIVDWVNQAFPRILPPAEDPLTGSVPYAPSHPFLPSARNPAVCVHPLFSPDLDPEARLTVSLIQNSRQEDPEGTIAVLVRSRSHLHALLPRLREAGVPFQAVDIDPLTQRPVIQDLCSLTKAVRHPGDNLAWLAVLRAPWSGLRLEDLDLLTGEETEDLVLSRLLDDAVVDTLSAPGRQRIHRIRPVLEQALNQRDRETVRRQVESCWLALGGPDCLLSDNERQDAEAFFQLLDTRFDSLLHVSADELDRAVRRLFAQPDTSAGHGVQVMTMHKAKGLEFDTVILPGLGRKPKSDEHQLLLWLERSGPRGQPDLLLAPMSGTGEDTDPVYSYLKRLTHHKSSHEDGRLLYVAATRAKNRLHLIGHTTVQDTGDPKPPASGSLLASLWPAVREEFERAAGSEDTGQETAAPGLLPQMSQPLNRLSLDWNPPEFPAGLDLAVSQAQPQLPDDVAFDWAGETVRCVGTCVHAWLVVMAEDAAAGWDRDRIRGLGAAVAGQLSELGILESDLEQGVELVLQSLENTLHDAAGRWILAPHQEAGNEYALSGRINGRMTSVVMDRTFVDERGVRWIVDYKTSRHEGTDSEEFLDREMERYRGQMETYARLMQAADNRPIRLGLYFPLLTGWREWAFGTFLAEGKIGELGN